MWQKQVSAVLQQIIPRPVQAVAVQQIGKECYKRLVVDVDWFSAQAQPCLKLLLSKLLGMAIVLGGGLVKLPQILKIVRNRSAEGLSLLSYLLETLAYAVSLAYNVRRKNPFSTYGETLFVTLQNTVILFLMMRFRGQHWRSVVVLGLLAAWSVGLQDGRYVGEHWLTRLQALTIPVSLVSKCPQILANYQQGHTGQLAAFTVFMYLAGTLARVFTTLQEVRDPLILTGYASAAVLNAVLAAQMMYYWSATNRALSKRKKE